jgi:tetratricopeptide (TPR) repeat protein
MALKLKIRQDALIFLLIAVAILVVYASVGNYEFLSFDDGVYVTENPLVQRGITREGFKWAFKFNDRGYWQPLTWISHMLDCHLFGLRAGMHHMTNLIIHMANSLLLFWVFYRMTGARWKSAFVAALFALHPINVESVAWVAGRKNLLSTFFWLVTILAYVRYCERTNYIRYVAVLIAFMLGLSTKPMLVTLPFVLLLLDYWPLGRFRFKQATEGGITVNDGSGQRSSHAKGFIWLIAEKVPFIVLSATMTILSMTSVQVYGIVVSAQTIPRSLRMTNALVSYAKYLGQFIWPHKLAAFYPFPEMVPAWLIVTALSLLVLVSAVTIRNLKNAPYLIVGWLWYLGTLMPAIGLVQVGLWPAMADRWAYVPLIGIFVMTAWGIPGIFSRFRFKKIILTGISVVVIGAATVVSAIQVKYWNNSIALFEHTIRTTEKNAMAHANLALALGKKNRHNESLYHYNVALRIDPTYAQVHNNLGLALLRHGEIDKALDHLRQAASLASKSDIVQNNLGFVLIHHGRINSAIVHFKKALSLNPRHAEASNNLGLALLQEGEIESAIFHFNRAAELRSGYVEALRNLKLALSINAEINRAVDRFLSALHALAENQESDVWVDELRSSKKTLNQAIARYQKSLSKQPGFTKIDINKIRAVNTAKKAYDKALPKFMQISVRQPEIADVDYHIACVCARQGKYSESILWLTKAIQKGFNDQDLVSADCDLHRIRDSSDYKEIIKVLRQRNQTALSISRRRLHLLNRKLDNYLALYEPPY